MLMKLFFIVKILCIQNRTNDELELNMTNCCSVSVALEFLCLLCSLYGSVSQHASVRISGFWEAGISESQKTLFVPQTINNKGKNHYSANVPLFLKLRSHASSWELLKECWVFYAYWEMNRGHQTHFTKAATNPPISKNFQSSKAGFELLTRVKASVFLHHSAPLSPFFMISRCVCRREYGLSFPLFLLIYYRILTSRFHNIGGQETELYHILWPPV